MPSIARRLALRRAVLPVDPFDGIGGEVGADRFADGCEEGLLAKVREEPEALQLVLYGVLHFGETQLDARRAQGLVELADRVGGGNVYAGDGLRRDHQPADRGR